MCTSWLIYTLVSTCLFFQGCWDEMGLKRPMMCNSAMFVRKRSRSFWLTACVAVVVMIAEVGGEFVLCYTGRHYQTSTLKSARSLPTRTLPAAALIEADINSFPPDSQMPSTHKRAQTHTQDFFVTKNGNSDWNFSSVKQSWARGVTATNAARGQHVSHCIPAHRPPSLSVSPNRLDPLLRLSLSACGLAEREGDSASAGKKVKRGCLSSAHHPELLLHNLWACYCNQKFFFIFWERDGEGWGGGDARWRLRSPVQTVSREPGPFHVKWDTAVMSLGWARTHNTYTKLWRKSLCVHKQHNISNFFHSAHEC